MELPKLLAKIFLIFILLGFFSWLGFSPTYSQSDLPDQDDQSASDLERTYEEKQKQIEELEKKIADLQSQERSLAGQIAYMDNQIRLTSLRIEQAENTLKRLVKEIEILARRIERVSASLDKLSGLLTHRIAATYKASSISPITLFASSGGFSDFISRYKYFQVVQANDKKLFYQMQATRDSYRNQKDEREDKKVEEEQTKKKLDALKIQLDQQKKEKETILAVTRNDERRYQELLRIALAEQQAIERILGLALDFKNGVDIKEGEVIALMGNSGAPTCSTGAHLHFTVVVGGSKVNPEGSLKSKSVTEDQGSGRVSINMGSGSWEWPLAEPIIVSQRFGKTPYSWRYPSGEHDGIDMYNQTNYIIKAPKGGKLVRGSQSCGGSILKFVAIDHGENTVTYYLHVQ